MGGGGGCAPPAMNPGGGGGYTPGAAPYAGALAAAAEAHGAVGVCWSRCMRSVPGPADAAASSFHGASSAALDPCTSRMNPASSPSSLISRSSARRRASGSLRSLQSRATWPMPPQMRHTMACVTFSSSGHSNLRWPCSPQFVQTSESSSPWSLREPLRVASSRSCRRFNSFWPILCNMIRVGDVGTLGHGCSSLDNLVDKGDCVFDFCHVVAHDEGMQLLVFTGGRANLALFYTALASNGDLCARLGFHSSQSITTGALRIYRLKKR